MNTTDLTTLTPQAAIDAMCAMDNGEMDRIAAEVQGWHKVTFEVFPPIEKWMHNNYVACYVSKWHPSTDLNQAYELARNLTKDTPWHFTLCIHSTDCFDTELEYEFVNQSTLQHEKPTIVLDQYDAGTIARAVTILACVGMLFGGGK